MLRQGDCKKQRMERHLILKDESGRNVISIKMGVKRSKYGHGCCNNCRLYLTCALSASTCLQAINRDSGTDGML